MDIFSFLQDAETGAALRSSSFVPGLSEKASENPYIDEIRTTTLASPAFESYYAELFAPFGVDEINRYLMHCVLNFGVHQLSRRAGFLPLEENYLQLGAFSSLDFPLAVRNCSNHVGCYSAHLDSGSQTIDDRTHECFNSAGEARIATVRELSRDEAIDLAPEIQFGFISVLNLTDATVLSWVVSYIQERLSEYGAVFYCLSPASAALFDSTLEEAGFQHRIQKEVSLSGLEPNIYGLARPGWLPFEKGTDE